MGNINMHNLKRKAAIAKWKQLHKGVSSGDILNEMNTSAIVAELRARGYIYEKHKFVKIYGGKK